MAYNGQRGRYQEVQHRSTPQGFNTQYNGYDQARYDQGDQGHGAFQQDAYDSNQQYSQTYDVNQEQYGNRPQNNHDVNNYQYAQAGQQQQQQQQQRQQPRQYQYDNRYRTNGRAVQEPGNAGRMSADGKPPPQASGSRPGTSASNRRMKRKSWSNGLDGVDDANTKQRSEYWILLVESH